MKRKIKFVWTCSDFVKHKHKTYAGAWLCGQLQYLWALINPQSAIPNPKLKDGKER
jgi:hypothetical protein